MLTVYPCKTWGVGESDTRKLVREDTIAVQNWGDGTFVDKEPRERVRTECHTTRGEWARAYHPGDVEEFSTLLSGVGDKVVDQVKECEPEVTPPSPT